jgi:N,N'-diacetyllegionaminate synthase
MTTNPSSNLWPAGHTYVIAEIGPNHDGDVNRALEMLPLIAKSGVDAIKFQTFVSASSVVAVNAPLADYMKKDQSLKDQEELLERIRLTFDDFRVISDACREHGITFLSTPFDVPSVEFLVELGVPLLKIPSGELTNFFLLKAAAKAGLPLIVSTGMATLEELSEAVSLIHSIWDDEGIAATQYPELAILHCTSAYPAPFSEVNLRAMKTLEKSCGLPVGYSDHTLGSSVSLAAVALGARIIEKHVTPDPSLAGPDHAASLPISDLNRMISDIREIEKSLGTDAKLPSTAESDVKLVARRAIVANSSISKGAEFKEEMLSALRPASGISPMDVSKLLGRNANRDYEHGEFINPDELD